MIINITNTAISVHIIILLRLVFFLRSGIDFPIIVVFILYQSWQ